jgi:hypothetical protein
MQSQALTRRALVSASVPLAFSNRVLSAQKVSILSVWAGSCSSGRYYLLLLLNVFFVFLFASSYWVLVSDAPMRVSRQL